MKSISARSTSKHILFHFIALRQQLKEYFFFLFYQKDPILYIFFSFIVLLKQSKYIILDFILKLLNLRVSMWIQWLVVSVWSSNLQRVNNMYSKKFNDFTFSCIDVNCKTFLLEYGKSSFPSFNNSNGIITEWYKPRQF